jgi:hypothetical protein
METQDTPAHTTSPVVVAGHDAACAPRRFYFTIHPSDASRRHLPPGCHVMLVAAAHWDDRRQRFRIRRPPADHVASLVVDSGGFTAARRWGQYPWSARQYADFVHAVSRDVPLDWCATMDYACEPTVDRGTLATNQARIDATLANERACLEADPTLPWLPVLQGDTLAERAYDLVQRQRLGLVPTMLAGIGPVCGRGAAGSIRVVRWYATQLPGVQYHAFGLDVRALDNDDVAVVVQSWDSYAWNWPKGRRGQGLASASLRRVDETYTQYVRRLAGLSWTQTIRPRLVRPRQLRLPLGGADAHGYEESGTVRAVRYAVALAAGPMRIAPGAGVRLEPSPGLPAWPSDDCAWSRLDGVYGQAMPEED